MTHHHTHTKTAALHPQTDLAATWGDFADDEPELAAFVAERLQTAPAYLATVRASGPPRVHPVTPIITADRYVLYELGPTEAQCKSYGDTTLPERRRWHARSDAPRPAITH